MTISIVVVSWNSREDLIALSATLELHIPNHYELIVVDNNSSDDSVEIAHSLPKSTVIQLADNQGFGAANNVGVQHAQYDSVALLNPDTRLVDSTLLKL